MRGFKTFIKKTFRLLVHIAIWLFFLSIPTIFNPHRTDFSFAGYVDDLLVPFRLTNGILLALVFYFNYHIAIPRLYVKRKRILFALSVLGCLACLVTLNHFVMPAEMRSSVAGGRRMLGPAFNMMQYLVVFAAAFALALYDQWQNTREQMHNAEMSFIKAQINPHFLFNTLNSIYSLALVKSDSVPDAIIRLSNMMRYSVSETTQNYVSLSKELGYISNYIDLQKLRLSGKIKLAFEIKGLVEDKQIPPILLMPFVENAFKYGVNPEEDSDINIRIDIGQSDLNLMVFNKKVNVRHENERKSGIGITQTKKRLQVLYPGKHKLQIDDTDNYFKVSLQIQLQ